MLTSLYIKMLNLKNFSIIIKKKKKKKKKKKLILPRLTVTIKAFDFIQEKFLEFIV